jgi:transcriptional regulator with XRE-family HTH domain
MRNDLGKHLRHRREQAGLTQKELAEKIKQCNHSVSRYESGLRMPSLTILRRIAKATGCELVLELQKQTYKDAQL